MSNGIQNNPRSAWWLVLGLVGLDYFSTLAYLPSMAVTSAGALAPLAALAVVLVTWLLALPVYWYLAGRAQGGDGAAGLLERIMPGWRGKILILTLLGFAAADYVVTRSLSIADAAVHVTHNAYSGTLVEQIHQLADALPRWFGSTIGGALAPFVTPQIVVSLLLSLLTFGFFWLLHRGFTPRVLWLIALVAAFYVVLVTLVVASGLQYLAAHPQLCDAWQSEVAARLNPEHLRWHWLTHGLAMLFASLWLFPQLALGLSGLELTMNVAPWIGRKGVDNTPRRRIVDTRKLLVAAVTLMSVLVIGTTFVTTILVPREAVCNGGIAQHRALAYLAHGGPLTGMSSGETLQPWFGPQFGTLFDVSTILILSLAGASVICGLRKLLLEYLHRLGMDLTWAGRSSHVMHLLNAVILTVTIVFHASLTAQQWAYATSVLVLLAGSSLVAALEVGRRYQTRRNHARRAVAAGLFVVAAGFFTTMIVLTVCIDASGFVIALAFVVVILTTSLVSRWLRSTELRFHGFTFADEASRERWQSIRRRPFQIVVAHRPGAQTIAEKLLLVQRHFRLAETAPLMFVEACVGDPSEFYQQPRLEVACESGVDVIRLSQCASVSHVLAALCLELCHPQGEPPLVLFGWSQERPLAANLHFLLLGEGNIPWMVKELLRRAIPNEARQPRVVIG